MTALCDECYSDAIKMNLSCTDPNIILHWAESLHKEFCKKELEMPIKFIQIDDASEELQFKDVEDNQFFISMDDELCQKHTFMSYIGLAGKDRSPRSFYHVVRDEKIKIKKILPRIIKIEF